jgi:2-dehydropantoate 2-reductase
MSYVVLGAGAIGAVVGGRLSQAGRDVTLIARGAHLAALQTRGLRLESPAGTDTLRLAAVGHPREIDWGTHPVVLMTVKSQQTPAALAHLVTVAPPETPIVCLQNGIANEPAALRLFPNVYAVSVACPTSHLEPGVVQAWSAPVTGLLDIGCYPTGNDQVSEMVAADLRAATFSSYPVEAIGRWKNRKLLTNLGNAIEAVCGPHERVGPLGDLLAAEGEAVLSAAGLAAATAQEDCDRRSDLLQPGGSQARPGPAGPHGKACGAAPETSRRTSSTVRSFSWAGYTAFRHLPTSYCSDWRETSPSPTMRPVRFPRRPSWSDSRRLASQLAQRSGRLPM